MGAQNKLYIYIYTLKCQQTKFLKIHSLYKVEWKCYGSGAKWFESLKKIFNSNLKVSKKNLYLFYNFCLFYINSIS